LATGGEYGDVLLWDGAQYKRLRCLARGERRSRLPEKPKEEKKSWLPRDDGSSGAFGVAGLSRSNQSVFRGAGVLVPLFRSQSLPPPPLEPPPLIQPPPIMVTPSALGGPAPPLYVPTDRSFDLNPESPSVIGSSAASAINAPDVGALTIANF